MSRILKKLSLLRSWNTFFIIMKDGNDTARWLITCPSQTLGWILPSYWLYSWASVFISAICACGKTVATFTLRNVGKLIYLCGSGHVPLSKNLASSMMYMEAIRHRQASTAHILKIISLIAPSTSKFIFVPCSCFIIKPIIVLWFTRLRTCF